MIERISNAFVYQNWNLSILNIFCKWIYSYLILSGSLAQYYILGAHKWLFMSLKFVYPHCYEVHGCWTMCLIYPSGLFPWLQPFPIKRPWTVLCILLAAVCAYWSSRHVANSEAKSFPDWLSESILHQHVRIPGVLHSGQSVLLLIFCALFYGFLVIFPCDFNECFPITNIFEELIWTFLLGGILLFSYIFLCTTLFILVSYT